MSKKIAIYSRKSKFNEKSESTDNQIQICKQYAIQNFDATEDDFLIFEDDGFSGKDIIRPGFQKMFDLIKSNKIHTLIVYRLDRVSRSVADASNIIDTLSKCDTNFVSISERFDTSTPIGKAMINVSSTFAQLERETIAERIKDNFIELAKKGRWTGGQTPTGYKSISVNNGDKQTMYLQQDEHINTIKIIFNKYKELHNLSQLAKLLAKDNIKSKNGNYFQVNTIRDILINPVYASADMDIYNFYSDKGAIITMNTDKFNGEFGVVPYNRYNKPINEWYIAVGIHSPIISGQEFVNIQNILYSNHHRNIRSGTGTHGILQGVLYCKCGSIMRPKTGKRDKDGVLRHYYSCTKKNSSSSIDCNSSNIIGRDIDIYILNHLFTKIYNNENFKKEVLSKLQCDHQNSINANQKIKELEELINAKNNQAEKIVNDIMNNTSSDFVTCFLIPKGEVLTTEINELKKELTILQEEQNKKDTHESIATLSYSIDLYDLLNNTNMLQKRILIKKVISSIQITDNAILIHYNNNDFDSSI